MLTKRWPQKISRGTYEVFASVIWAVVGEVPTIVTYNSNCAAFSCLALLKVCSGLVSSMTWHTMSGQTMICSPFPSSFSSVCVLISSPSRVLQGQVDVLLIIYVCRYKWVDKWLTVYPQSCRRVSWSRWIAVRGDRIHERAGTVSHHDNRSENKVLIRCQKRWGESVC